MKKCIAKKLCLECNQVQIPDELNYCDACTKKIIGTAGERCEKCGSPITEVKISVDEYELICDCLKEDEYYEEYRSYR